MRPGIYGRLGLLLVAFLVSGCGQMNLGGGGGANSNNKGKIEGTRWSNHAGSIKRAYFRTDVVRMDFRGDGSMNFQAGPERISGKYELGNGDTVYFTLEKAFAGSKYFSETITIAGDTLIMADPDGTSITFRKTGGPAVTPPPEPESKPETKPETPVETKRETKPATSTKTESIPQPPERNDTPPETYTPPRPKPDSRSIGFRGLWSITENTYDGKKTKLNPFESDFVITAERMNLRIQAQTVGEATYTCDFSKLPVHVDLKWEQGQHQGKVSLGLIQLVDGSLHLVLAEPGQPRPTNFDAQPGAKHEKLVLDKPRFK